VDGTKSGNASVTVTTPMPTVASVVVSPSTVSVEKGKSQNFSAVVNGTNSPVQTVTWSVSGNSSSSTNVSIDGLLTVANNETSSLLTVTATSTVDGTKSGNALVTVTTPMPTVASVVVSPSTASVEKGKTQSFSATVTGTNSPAQTVTWSVSGNSSSSTNISIDGLLTVANNETSSLLTVMATSTVDGTKSGNASVTVTTPTSIEPVNVQTVIVWSQDGIVYVESSDKTIQKVIMHNLSGWIVYTSHPGTKEVTIENLPRGKIIIITISLNGGKIERRKIVTK
jgi:hypothetical protein